MLHLILAILVAELLERICEVLWAACVRRYRDWRAGKPTARQRLVAFVYGLVDQSKASFAEIEKAAMLKYPNCDKYHALRQANEIVNRLGVK